MKRAFYILFSLVVLISCKSKNDLDGIWIGAYQIYYSGSDSTLTSVSGFAPVDTSYTSMRLLLDISKDEIISKTFDYPMFEEKDTMRISKYSIVGNRLIFDSDTFVIKGITEDSLILNVNSHCERDFIFKRLPENNDKIKIDIINNAFSLIGPNYADSIDFVNDSLILHVGNVFNSVYRSRHWAINSYKSLDFLVFDQIESPPLLISDYSAKDVSLKLYFTTIKDFKMTKIESGKDTSGIIGNWVWPFQNNQDLPLPPPLPLPPNYPDNVDTKLYLRIKKDSLEIEQFGRMKSKIWKLNSTNDFIYFPEYLLTKEGVWKILKIDGDKLDIEWDKRFTSSGGKEKIEFYRMKNNTQQCIKK